LHIFQERNVSQHTLRIDFISRNASFCDNLEFVIIRESRVSQRPRGRLPTWWIRNSSRSFDVI